MKPCRLALVALLAAALPFAVGCEAKKAEATRPSLDSKDPKERIQVIDDIEKRYSR